MPRLGLLGTGAEEAFEALHEKVQDGGGITMRLIMNELSSCHGGHLKC